MSNAIITIDLPSVYDQRAVARAAAEEVANLIGDQVKPWRISVSEAATELGWLVEVKGAGNKWAMVFDADDQNVITIVAQFKLNLQPYVASRKD